MSDKRETENIGDSCGSSRGGTAAGVRVKQLLFISDTVSGGLLGCSPLKVLQSLNLAHIQSLRWRVHRKTCEWKSDPVSRRDIKKLWHMAADLLRFCSHLEGWGRHGPSSASFSSSLRWRSQSAAAADHSYGSTGRARTIPFHPIQNPVQDTSVALNDRLRCRDTKLFFVKFWSMTQAKRYCLIWSRQIIPVIYYCDTIMKYRRLKLKQNIEKLNY